LQSHEATHWLMADLTSDL